MTSTHQPLLHLGLRVKWVHQGRVPPLTPITLGDGCAVKSSPLREGDGDSLPGRHPGGEKPSRQLVSQHQALSKTGVPCDQLQAF